MATILIVDDVPEVRETIRTMLSLEGDHQFLEAGDGTRALQILRQEPVDLLLLDVRMPGLDGFAVCQQVKADPRTETIPVIFMTGQSQDEPGRLRGLALGADDFLAKPVNSRELALRVRNLLRAKGAEDGLRRKRQELEAVVEGQKQELARTRAEYLEFLEGATDLISAVDCEGYFFFANRLHARLLGRTPEQLCETNVFDLIPPEQERTLRDALGRTQTQGSSPLVELDLRAGGESLLPVEVQVSKIQNDAGHFIGYRMVARDIRQRRALEKELKLRVEELERLNEYKTKFLAGMSHEFFTPMTAILSYIRFVMTDDDPPVHPRHAEDLKKALDAAEYLQELMGTILDMSHIESGRMTVHEEEVSLPELVDHALLTVGELARQKGIALEKELPRTVPPIATDALKVKQILINLLSNACRYTDHGSITVRVMPYSDGIQVSVKDTGIGIHPEKMSDLFEEFRQLHDVAQRKGGRGLGLALSRKLARLLGGNIQVQSEPGIGSTFSLLLPLSRVQAPTAPPTSNWVLILDPLAWNRELLRRELASQGYTALGAGVVADLAGIQGGTLASAVVVARDLLPPGGAPELRTLLGNGESHGRTLPVLVREEVEEAAGIAPVPGGPTELTGVILGEEICRAWFRELQDRPGEVYLVDDLLDFREFLEELLAQARCTYQSFATGADLMQALHLKRPKLVFMDLMLGDTDGFRLVEKIRETQGLTDLPVFVLTARDLSHVERHWLLSRTLGILSKDSRQLMKLILKM